MNNFLKKLFSNSDIEGFATVVKGEITSIDYPVHFDIEEAEKVLSKYDKFSSRDEEIQYHKYHLNRYLLTLDEMVGYERGIRVLEIGAPPFGMSMLIKNLLFSELDMSAFNDKQECCYHDREYDSKVTFKLVGGGVEEYKVPQFNIEKDAWPYDDSSYDFLIASEVLEHLAFDPMHMFCEANRVLKEGGSFLITVPNATSYLSLARLLENANPNGFPYYRPEGINMRHNREITCNELYAMYESAGFTVQKMKTVNPTVTCLPEPDINRLSKVCALSHFIENKKELIIATGKKYQGIKDRFPLRERLYYQWDVERLLTNLR